ncbi:MAG: Uma2 family endonuclease [Stenomitos rutilans HA7619-LM2]|jgi:Uma2 family endonuclease|nr:Uma2 family endonuclease [Stenomitos rutilans HA7619-LM2]
MTTLLPHRPPTEPFYPTGDGEPVAETYDHFYVLAIVLEVLRQFLVDRQATVLGNQFLYYAQGFPRLRTAPDVMVIFDVPPGGRDNYKIWEEGQVPAVIFEMTSKGTRQQDEGFKKTLYEQLGVQEYWQFDPKGEWIPEQLRGYRLRGETYELITDAQSQPLQLRLAVDGKLIAFYRLDTGEKLLIPDELATALAQQTAALQQAETQTEQERQRAERLAARLRELGEDPEGL